MGTKAIRQSVVFLLLALAVGCASQQKPTTKNLQKALNDYFENHNECLFSTPLKFPYEVAPGTDAKEEKKRMDALTSAGLLKREEAPAMKVDRYTLTPLGERVAGRFCYGHRQVDSVDSFTAPEKRNGFLETTASYHYTMMDVPVWAKTDEMKQTFPAMANSISGNPTDQMTLASAGAGWQVPQ